MASQADLDEAYAQGRADRAAGEPDKTEGGDFEELVASIATGGLASLLPPYGLTEFEKAYRAGYYEDDDD